MVSTKRKYESYLQQRLMNEINGESLLPPHDISQGTVTSLFSVKCSFVNSLRFSTPKRLAIVFEQNYERLLGAKKQESGSRRSDK